MSKLIYLAITCVVLCFLSSCSEESSNELKPKDQTLDFKVENGMLCFKDSSALNSLMTTQGNLSSEEINKWEKSIGFESYNRFFNIITEKYEEITKLKESTENELKLIEFISTYSKYVYNPTEPIDGLPDYSIEPMTLRPDLMRYINSEGDIMINNKVCNFLCNSNDKKSKSSSLKSIQSVPQTCNKKAGKRKMTIVYVLSPGGSYGATVYSKKKSWVGWISYKADFHWEFDYISSQNNSAPYIETNRVYTNKSVKNGSWLYIMHRHLSAKGKIWNSGVKEKNACNYITW